MDLLTDYPYNRIRQVLDQLVKKKQQSDKAELTAIPIIKEVRICYLDSNEIFNMLSYLTSFGRVKKTENGWVLEKHHFKNKYDKFRQDYLKDSEDVLKGLSDIPKSAEEIASEINKPTETVKSLLSFLEEVTSQGIVTQVSEKFPPTWELF
ncbi:MAG: hypothetical protein ACFFC7_24275 [Candidatus Hermodarchaeota archaeon]